MGKDLNETAGDLLDALDVEVGEEGVDSWILQHLVNLTDIVHAAVEQDGFVVLAWGGVSIGWREEHDDGVEKLKAVEEVEMVGGVLWT